MTFFCWRMELITFSFGLPLHTTAVNGTSKWQSCSLSIISSSNRYHHGLIVSVLYISIVLLDFRPSTLLSPLLRQLTRIHFGASLSFLPSLTVVAELWSLCHLLQCHIQQHRRRTAVPPRTKDWCVGKISSTSMDKGIIPTIAKKPPIHYAMIGRCLSCTRTLVCPFADGMTEHPA